MEILVSVVMPAYNCAGTIGDSIASVLCQTVPLELIVVNDRSPDDLDAAMAPWLADPRVVYVTNEENMGAARSRNRAMEMARGKYIAFLDSDDIWLPGKLEKQVKLLEESGSVLCCTARALMTPEGVDDGRVLCGGGHHLPGPAAAQFHCLLLRGDPHRSGPGIPHGP